jgi:hypothetical protein
MFLAFTAPDDPHGPAVRDALARRGVEAHLVDVAELPRRTTISARYDGGAPATTLALDGRRVRLDALRGIWWRRPRPLEAHEDLWRPSHREFAVAQWAETLGGLWDALPVRWVNHPARGDAARKPLQLAIARECGLRAPRTLVTSDPDAARAFVEELGGPGRVVYKHLAGLPGVGREAQLVDRDALARLDQCRYAPVIFQERVPGDLDLRVTVAGDAVFAASLDARRSAYPLDWRVDFDGVRVAADRVSDHTADGLRAMLARLGLGYGAFDLRRTPDGEEVFLEVNPFGRFTFIECRTGQPIADAIAAALDAPKC